MEYKENAIMAQDFDRVQYFKDLENSLDTLKEAAQLGADLGAQSHKRLLFVACGAPNRVMALWEYWLQRYTTKLEIRRYFPAEFIHQDPPILDADTLVILASHSGTTKETVEAAQFLEDRPCTTVAITQTSDSPLAQAVKHVLTYGPGERGYYALFLLMSALVSGFYNALEGWPLHDKLMQSLPSLPEVMADAIEANEARVTEDARLYKDEQYIYMIGAGPMYTTVYVIGVCILMEMLWLNVQPLVAAEFFHGPFEAIDQNTPFILFLGEDPSRPEAERVLRFCKKYSQKLMIYDSMDYEMNGIHPDVRPILAPLVLDASVSRMADHLSDWLDKPLNTRRYMWKTEY